MFGMNVMKAMTKEDAIQLANAHKFLVPLHQYREQVKLKPPMPKLEQLEQVNEEIYDLRLQEREKETELSNKLIKSTLEDLIKNNKKKNKI
jgi:hypothetical protein